MISLGKVKRIIITSVKKAWEGKKILPYGVWQMFWNWINNMDGVLPPFLFTRPRYTGWSVIMDRFFFQNRNVLGNLILWPLIIWVSFCKQRHLQTYNQILWFGCKPITHKRQGDISIQLSLCWRIVWTTKALRVKGSGWQREAGGGSLVSMDTPSSIKMGIKKY